MAASGATSKTVGFVPAVTFMGFPDGVTGIWYRAGHGDSAPEEYVKLLRSKGLVADEAADEAAHAADESEEE